MFRRPELHHHSQSNRIQLSGHNCGREKQVLISREGSVGPSAVVAGEPDFYLIILDFDPWDGHKGLFTLGVDGWWLVEWVGLDDVAGQEARCC